MIYSCPGPGRYFSGRNGAIVVLLVVSVHVIHCLRSMTLIIYQLQSTRAIQDTNKRFPHGGNPHHVRCSDMLVGGGDRGRFALSPV